MQHALKNCQMLLGWDRMCMHVDGLGMKWVKKWFRRKKGKRKGETCSLLPYILIPTPLFPSVFFHSYFHPKD